MTNTNRRRLKYITDVFINPAKSVALVFHPLAFILTGAIIFGIVEFFHCSAHIIGAWDKYQSGQKSLGWMIAKNAIFAGRLVTSLIGASTLVIATIMGSYALTVAGFPVFAIAFMISSVLSTLHKVRGLIDHLLHVRESGVTTPADGTKTKGLIIRAAVGVLGSGLTIAVLLKVAVVMLLVINPYTFAVGIILFTAMAVWKARLAYKEYHHPKYPTSTSTATMLAAEESQPSNQLDHKKTAMPEQVKHASPLFVPAPQEVQTSPSITESEKFHLTRPRANS